MKSDDNDAEDKKYLRKKKAKYKRKEQLREEKFLLLRAHRNFGILFHVVLHHFLLLTLISESLDNNPSPQKLRRKNLVQYF